MNQHLATFFLLASVPNLAQAAEITFPGPHGNLQATVESAAAGDVIRIAPGTYENTALNVTKAVSLIAAEPGKAVILDGGGKKAKQAVITIRESAREVHVEGLTLQNGPHGLLNRGEVHLKDCVFTGNQDALSFENGRGTIRRCLFEKSKDDGIDFDNASQGLIEDCISRDNGDDGIEIRLHPLKKEYAKGPLNITLLRCSFIGNGEDGIQLIDYEGKSPRLIRIEGCLFVRNAMADLACMPDGDTKEKLTGAPLLEPVLVIHNTFAGGSHAITGGDNMLLLNNLITGYTRIGLKRIHGDSAAGPNLLWNNTEDIEDSDLDTTDFVFADPLLNADHVPAEESPAHGKAVPTFDFNGQEITPEKPLASLGAK